MTLSRTKKAGVISISFGVVLGLAFVWVIGHPQEFFWLWSFIEPSQFYGEYPNLVYGAPVLIGIVPLFVLFACLFFIGLGIKWIWASRKVKHDPE